MEQTNSLVISNQVAIADPNTIYHSFSFDDIISVYLIQLDCSDTTKKIYRRSLNTFSYYLNKRGIRITDVNRAVMLDYKRYLIEAHIKNEEKILKGKLKSSNRKKGLSSRSAGLYLSAVKSLFRFLKANGCPVNPTEDLKAPKIKRQYTKRPLSIKQTKEIVRIEDNSRNKALRLLLIGTGLRTIEVSRANIEDLTYIGDKRVLKVQGKGRDEKDQFVIISKSVNDAISDYLISRNGADDSEPLFISNSTNPLNQGRLSTRSIRRIIKSNLKEIGLIDNSFTTHSLRHSTACNILRANGSIEQVQQTLRHSDISTSQIYVATMEEERRLQNSGEDLIEGILSS